MLNRILSEQLKAKSQTSNTAGSSSSPLPAPLLNFIHGTNGTDSKITPMTSTAEVEAQGRLAHWLSLSDSDPMIPKGFSRRQRFIGFTLCLLGASLCLSLAMVFIPLLATPFGMRKYVILHSMGSLLLISSFGFLWGPWNHLKSLCSSERWPFTVCFIGSVFGGLYSVIAWQSAFFAFFFLMLQILSIAWQVFSAIPGGKAGLSAIVRGAYWSIRGFGSALPV